MSTTEAVSKEAYLWMKVMEEQLLKEIRTVKSTIENNLDTVIADENRTLSEQAKI